MQVVQAGGGGGVESNRALGNSAVSSLSLATQKSKSAESSPSLEEGRATHCPPLATSVQFWVPVAKRERGEKGETGFRTSLGARAPTFDATAPADDNPIRHSTLHILLFSFGFSVGGSTGWLASEVQLLSVCLSAGRGPAADCLRTASQTCFFTFDIPRRIPGRPSISFIHPCLVASRVYANDICVADEAAAAAAAAEAGADAEPARLGEAVAGA